MDRLLPVSEDGSRTEALDFACLRLSSPGVRQLCDAAVRRLDLRTCSSNEMQALLRRFTGAAFANCHFCLSRLIEYALMLHVPSDDAQSCLRHGSYTLATLQATEPHRRHHIECTMFFPTIRHRSAGAAAVLRLVGRAAITAAAAHRPAQPPAAVRILLATHHSIRRPDSGKRGYDGLVHCLPLPLCGQPAHGHESTTLNVAMTENSVQGIRRGYL